MKNAQPSGRIALPKRPPTQDLLDFLRATGLARADEPVHYLASAQAPRITVRGTVRHTSTHVLSRGTLVRIYEGVYVLSPEALYAEAARGRGLAACTRLANRLTGSYAINPKNGELEECAPPTSVAALESHLLKSKRAERNRALRALRWAVDGCASPMESNVELLACLPQRYGGWGLPLPQMNYEVALPPWAKSALGCSECRIDLAWPEAQAGIEYNSRAFHSETSAWERDAHRQNILEAQGYRIVPLTWPQLASPQHFETVIRQIARLIGFRLQIRNGPARRAAERALREEIFDG